MAKRRKIGAWGVAGSIVVALVAAVLIAPWLSDECDICEAATSILLVGTVPGKCTIEVTPAPGATNLPIATSGAHRVMIGTVLQDCTGRRSYTLTVGSMNCAAAPTGGKVLEPVTGEFLSYSGEFINPATGGSETNVLGLLATSCSGQVGRAVNHAKIDAESSAVYVNFTGSPTLAAGTYEDIFIISLNMQ
jgi:hypothetical protein